MSDAVFTESRENRNKTVVSYRYKLVTERTDGRTPCTINIGNGVV